MTRGWRIAAGALAGVISAGVALGVGELVAAFIRPRAAPVIAVGNRFIALTPESLKEWAIREFGTNDKTALLTGIYVVLGIFAAAIGILALVNIWYGLVGIALFGAIGVYAAVTAPAHHSSDVVPTILGTLAGAATLVMLIGRLQPHVGPAQGGLDRRRFLQAGLATAVLAAVTGVLGRAAQHARFNVASARAAVRLPNGAPTKLPPGHDFGKTGTPWQTPNGDFYRIDTALSLPQVDPKTWSLRIHGMVGEETVLTYDQLLARPMIERWITLNCVSNPVGGPLVGNALFLGTRLADLLREAHLDDRADELLMTSIDGMTIGAPAAVVMDGRDALIAVGMNGEPLPVEHGFPARAIVPGLYGYLSACKWIINIEATTFAATAAYWVSLGWAAQTDIKLASRIDTPKNGAAVHVHEPLTIAGVAWDQHVGVSKVDVQVNDGAWQTARLATVPSTDTWRQWLLSWTPPQPGPYRLRVRATDGRGRPQTTAEHDPFPQGATGLHTITIRAQ